MVGDAGLRQRVVGRPPDGYTIIWPPLGGQWGSKSRTHQVSAIRGPRAWLDGAAGSETSCRPRLPGSEQGCRFNGSPGRTIAMPGYCGPSLDNAGPCRPRASGGRRLATHHRVRITDGSSKKTFQNDSSILRSMLFRQTSYYTLTLAARGRSGTATPAAKRLLYSSIPRKPNPGSRRENDQRCRLDRRTEPASRGDAEAGEVVVGHGSPR